MFEMKKSLKLAIRIYNLPNLVVGKKSETNRLTLSRFCLSASLMKKQLIPKKNLMIKNVRMDSTPDYYDMIFDSGRNLLYFINKTDYMVYETTPRNID